MLSAYRFRGFLSLRACRGTWRSAAVTAAGTVLLLASLLTRLPARTRSAADFPRANPARLAHLLADFSHQYTLGSWVLEEEKNNYTSWHYTVRYSCGARCEGRAAIEAHELLPGGEGGGVVLAHGHHDAPHLVRVRDERCARLPLLPWPRLCEVSETETWVLPMADGSRVEESAVAWCGAARAATGACGAELRAAAALRLRRLHLRALVPVHRQ